MRDSINYNLKYFIMRTSGTKPMKNTMRKPSPLKFFTHNAALDATKKVSDAAGAAAKKAKDTGTTKPAKGKPKLTKDNTVKVGGMIRVSKEKAAEVAAKEKKEPTKAKATVSNQGVKNLRAAIKAKAAAKAAGKTETSVKEVAPKSNPAGKPSAKPTATETSVKSTTKSPTSVKSSTETSVKSKTPKSNPAGKPASKPVEGKPSAKPATKSVTKEMIGGGGVPQLRKHKR
jgi:hypothetical protein